MTYRNLQKQLKNFRSKGLLNKGFRLNQKKAVLNRTLNKLLKKEIKPNKRREQKKIKLKKTVVDAIKGFTSRRFKSNTTTLRGLWDAITIASKKEKQTSPFISIYVRDKINNKIKEEGITIHPDFTNSYKDFTLRIRDILKGDVAGSDRYNLAQYEIVKNQFEIKETTAEGFGPDSMLLFKSKKFKNDNLCWMHVLKELKLKPDKDLSNYEKFTSYLIENNINIDIIANSFKFKKGKLEQIKKRKVEKYFFSKRKRDIPVYKLKDSDIITRTIFCPNGYSNMKKVIIYDFYNKHYGITDKVELDDLYIDRTNSVYKLKTTKKKKELILMKKAKELNKTNGLEFGDTVKYIFFDYETIVDFNEKSIMKDYSLSFFVADDNILDKLNKLDKLKDKKGVKKLVKDRLFNCVKFNSTDMLRDYIIKNQERTRFKLISFNGSNFDNFILLNHLLNNKNENWDCNNIFYNGTSLQNFKINGRHSMFDLRKHLVGSLKKNCEDFNINICSKLDFDHNYAQSLYDKGELLNYMKDNKELIEYNNYDVLSLAILFWRYKQELKGMKITKQYGEFLTDHGTIGSIIYDIFTKHCSKKNYFFRSMRPNKKKIDPYLLTDKEYNDLQKHKIAGRVELFNGALQVFEKIVSLDVCSLYPYVLSILNVYYPHGAITRTDTFKGLDKIGFYYCDIDQSNLRKNNLPNIYAEKTKTENKWDSDKKLENYLISTVMIKLLQDYGCRVNIKNGFYWDKKAKSCDMFGFLNEFMGAKNKQDEYKKDKSDKYNSALRNTLKLLMNAISGKVIEKLHLENTKEIDAYKYLQLTNNKEIENITAINIIGDKVFTTYKQTMESKLHTQRPIFLGVLCYDYAKDYMYRNCYSIIGLKDLLYTDTDAGKFRDRHMERFLKHSNNTVVPHWEEVEKIDPRYKTHKLFDPNSKVFGSFENELSENNYFCCVQKKAWCVYNEDKLVKWGFKGVSNDSILLDSQFRYSDYEMYKYALNNQDKRLDYKDKDGNTPNIKKLFKQVLYKGGAYVLCQSFRKSVKNSKCALLDETDRFNKYNNTISLGLMVKDILLNKDTRCKKCKNIITDKCIKCNNYKLVIRELKKKFK